MHITHTHTQMRSQVKICDYFNVKLSSMWSNHGSRGLETSWVLSVWWLNPKFQNCQHCLSLFTKGLTSRFRVLRDLLPCAGSGTLNPWKWRRYVRWKRREPLTQALSVICYRGADKSLTRPGRKQAAPVKVVIGQRNGLIWLGQGHVVDCCECGNEPPISLKFGECSLFPSWLG